MTLRVVLYAEGAAERLGVESVLPASGDVLRDELLGAGHILMRRAISKARSIPEPAIRFESPLRTRGRIPRGSDLHNERTIRQLLTWLNPSLTPDLVVVLIDCDGEHDRKRRLEGHVAGLPCTKVIALAVEEFEAWLLADVATLAGLAAPRAYRGRPESLKPGEAKAEFSAYFPREALRETRMKVAHTCDLDVVAKECASFADVLHDIAAGH